MKTTILLVLLAILLGFGFLLGDYLSKRRHVKRKKSRSLSKFPLSAFSVFDHPAASVGQEKFSPLREADVYMTYGKKHEAMQVLNTALRKGEVSAQEVESFWAKYGPPDGNS
jgi:hypothetical protein